MGDGRDGFSSKHGFVLSCLGSSLGMGDIWRFPIMVCIWGGLSFLIPYFIFVALIACSGVIAEFALGRAAGAGPVGAFGLCSKVGLGKPKVGERLGLIPVIGSLAMAMGYTCILAWVIKYTWLAFSGEMTDMGQDMAVIGGAFDETAGAFGATGWVIIAVVLTLVIMSFGVSKGIERANKVLMPLLLILFVGLGIYVFTLPGASAGYDYILTLNTSMLADPMLWIFAFGQALFSMSVAGNGSVIYGSYFSRKESVPSAAGYVAVLDTLGALLAAFVIIPAMASGGGALDTAGPGLMFVSLVNVFNGMEFGRVIAAVFFLSVAFAGISSLINLYEAPIAYLQERFNAKRWMATALILVIGGTVAVFIQAIVSDWMDAVSIYVCPLGAMLAAIMFFWIAGRDFVSRSVNEGARRPIGSWFFPLGKYVYVACTLFALVAGALLGGIG